MFNSNHQCLYIKYHDPIDSEHIALPIDPYTLGLWLGDGNKTDGRINSNSDDYESLVNILKDETISNFTRSKFCGFGGRFTIYCLSGKLKKLNLIKNKHIPDIYLKGSLNQKLELLRGLMDSDGNCNSKNGSCQFYQKNLSLINQVRTLLSLLGIKTRLGSKIINGETYYKISFATTRFYVFNLPRKRKNQDLCKNHPKNSRDYIKNIKKVESVPVKCIQVDSEDHLFLCGETMIPTHNSTCVGIMALHLSIFTADKTIGVVSNKERSAKMILHRIKRMYESLPFYLKPGVKSYNKTSIEFENGSKIIASATSPDALRGESINCIDGKSLVCVINDDDEIFYTEIRKAEYYVKGFNSVIPEDKKFYTVYKTTNKVNGKIYVGFHSTNDLDDGYLGSGKILKRAIEKYGVDNFKKEYIAIFDNRKDAENLEREIVNKDFVCEETNYNVSVGGNVAILYGKSNDFYGKTHSKETIDSIRNKKIGSKHSEETKRAISKSTKETWKSEELRRQVSLRSKGQKFSEATRLKISMAHKGKIVTEDTRCKLSKVKKEFFANLNEVEYEAWYKKTFTDERNLKISKSKKGEKHSEEHVNKVNRNPEKIRKTAETHRGMKISEESKKLMSKEKKGKSPHNIGKVYCYDPITLEKKLCYKEDIPLGWVRGFVPKCKS